MISGVIFVDLMAPTHRPDRPTLNGQFCPPRVGDSAHTVRSDVAQSTLVKCHCVAVGEGSRQSSVDEAERAIATIFLAARAGQLLLSAFMVITQRRRVRHPKLHLLLLGGAVGESAWVTYRIVKDGRYGDRVAMWSDTLASAAGLVMSEPILAGDAGAPWMKNLVIGSAVGLNASDRRGDRISGLAVLGASELWSGLRARGRDSHVAGLSMAASDVINLIGIHLTSHIYVAMRRGFAILLDQATALRIQQAAAMSAEKERTRQQQHLHGATIEVLTDISACQDRETAAGLAQREAGRLRHILRTKGQVPSRLDRVLYDVSEEVRLQGLAVELVNAELDHELEPETIVTAHTAIHEAALVALELGHAHRAVIRATSNPEEVEVTIRDHGLGFVPGNGSLYEERLGRLHEMLRTTNGSVHIWSAEGGGVRVTLRFPAIAASIHERLANQSVESLPDIGIRRRPERDHNGTIHNGDINRSIDPDLFGASEDQIGGVDVINDINIGGMGPTLQTSSQQWSIGHNLSGRTGTHSSRMPGVLKDFVGRIAPFAQAFENGGSHEEARAEQTLYATFLVNRLSGLANGAVALLGGWGHVRNKGLSIGQVGLAVVETVWLVHRARRRPWMDGRAACVEAITMSTTQMIGRMNTSQIDRVTWVNWAPWSLATNAIAGQAMAGQVPAWRRVGASVIIGVTASWALSDTPGEFVANGAGMAWFFVGGAVIARQTRQSLARLSQANESAITEGARLAEAGERLRQLRYLHDGALQTLETVGSGRYADLESIRAVALQEASRLQQELASDPLEIRSLKESLEQIIRVHARDGFEVELQYNDIADPMPEVISALRDATSEALTNVRKHANSERAVIRVEERSALILVAVQDFGCGFDAATRSGFGTEQSISRRMRDVGGSSEIRSRRGGGTEVFLWGPT